MRSPSIREVAADHHLLKAHHLGSLLDLYVFLGLHRKVGVSSQGVVDGF
jgi:hypothetical protein